MDDPHPVDELAAEFPRWAITYHGGLIRGRRRQTSPVVYLRARTAAILREAILAWEQSWHAPETYGSWEAAMDIAERITNGNH